MSSVSIISGVTARVKSLINNEPSDPQKSLVWEMEGVIKLLKAADHKTKRSKQFVKLERLIAQLCYDIADAVEQGTISKPKQRLSNLFRRNSRAINGAAADLESLAINLKNLKNLVEYVVKEQKGVPMLVIPPPVKASGSGSGSRVEREVMEALRRADQHSVVCVYGDRGTGKTTLAKKVFESARDGSFNFMGSAWVRVKPACEPRAVFEDILQQLNPAVSQADIRAMDEIGMIQKILVIQADKKCLVVLEDISATQDWENIRVALLAGRSTRTLVTTPSLEVAKLLSARSTTTLLTTPSQLPKMPRSTPQLYIMPPLNAPQISTLLKDKASFDNQELEAYKEIILNLSGGLPLFAVVLGKSFKAADEIARAELVDGLEDNRHRVYTGENAALDACYRILPDELKSCLSYMGQFPEGQAIEVDKLHLMLEAEGIMPPQFYLTETKDKEFGVCVRNMLEKLAWRDLVKVEEASMTRRYKSCQLHPLIRNFCIFKGMEEELFEIVDFGERIKKISTSTCRLAVYLNNYKDGDSITFTPDKIRSLLIFDTVLGSPRRSTWPSEISDLKEMSKLRVVDFKGVNFSRVGSKVLKGIDKLVFLRYLSFRGCWLEVFPSSISKLLFLETLDLRVHGDCTMIIPNILSNLTRLRNLYFPLRYESKAKLHVFRLRSLEVLVNFHTGVCDVDDLLWLTNLQILATICEGHHIDLEAIVGFSCKPQTTLQQSSFIIRNFNHSAAVLKGVLECQSLHSLHIHGHIERLPEDVAISANLREIVFDGSKFEGDPTTLLQRLKNLRSLVLTNDAFVGESLAFSRNYFPNLRSLKLSNLHHLQGLAFHKRSMPKLSTLVVENCENLKKILMPTALDKRLRAAQRKKGDDIYMLDQTPIKFGL